MKKKPYPTHSLFPWKKCWIATAVILIVATIVLSLFYAIAVNHPRNDKSWIFFVIWGIVFGLMLFSYWIGQTIRYVRNRKEEK